MGKPPNMCHCVHVNAWGVYLVSVYRVSVTMSRDWRERERCLARSLYLHASVSHMRVHVYVGRVHVPHVCTRGGTRVFARWTARRLEAPWMWRRSSPLANSTTWTWPRYRVSARMPCMRACVRTRACVRACVRMRARNAAYFTAGTVDCGRRDARKSALPPIIHSSRRPPSPPTPSRIRTRESASHLALFRRFKVTFDMVFLVSRPIGLYSIRWHVWYTHEWDVDEYFQQTFEKQRFYTDIYPPSID